MYTDWEPSPRSSRQSNRRFKKVRGSSALRAEQVRTNEGARRGLYLRGLVLYPPLLLRRLALNSLYVHRFGQESCGSRQPPSSSLSLILSPKKREVGGKNEAGAATGSFRLVLLLLFHANLIPSLLTSVRNTIYKISDRKPERPHALEFLILVRPLSSPPFTASTTECGKLRRTHNSPILKSKLTSRRPLHSFSASPLIRGDSFLLFLLFLPGKRSETRNFSDTW